MGEKPKENRKPPFRSRFVDPEKRRKDGGEEEKEEEGDKDNVCHVRWKFINFDRY